MPISLAWHDIALRLALSVLAGVLMGLDRGEHRRPAGLRTTLLVCLAAALAMIQANLLMVTRGKPSDSFVVLDLMRLPLGILTGVGFIGAGAILRRDNLVLGVTTAATLWFVTVIGLCFGGGQIALGLAGLALGVVVLSGLRWFDHHMSQEQHGILNLNTKGGQPTEDDIQTAAREAGYKIRVSSVAFAEGRSEREIEFNLEWRSAPQKVDVPDFVQKLSSDPRVVGIRWRLA